MRITSGFAKGFTIKVPKITDIRPAQEVVRLAAFSILFDRVEEAQVLDIYAGSGAFGLESLSRGAKHVTFVDSNPLSAQTINENLTHARFSGKSEIVRQDALRYLMDTEDMFDLIFAAPPYAYGAPKPLLYQLGEHLLPGGLLIFDHARTSVLPRDLGALTLIDQRSYGATGLSFLQIQDDQITRANSEILPNPPSSEFDERGSTLTEAD